MFFFGNQAPTDFIYQNQFVRQMMVIWINSRVLVHTHSWVFFCEFKEWSKFLHDQPWISPWIKIMSNELDIIIHVIASQLSIHCQQLIVMSSAENKLSKWDTRMMKIKVLSSFMDLLCCVRNKIIYVNSWRKVYVPTWALFCCLFPSLPRNVASHIEPCQNRTQIYITVWHHKQ